MSPSGVWCPCPCLPKVGMRARLHMCSVSELSAHNCYVNRRLGRSLRRQSYDLNDEWLV